MQLDPAMDLPATRLRQGFLLRQSFLLRQGYGGQVGLADGSTQMDTDIFQNWIFPEYCSRLFVVKKADAIGFQQPVQIRVFAGATRRGAESCAA